MVSVISMGNHVEPLSRAAPPGAHPDTTNTNPPPHRGARYLNVFRVPGTFPRGGTTHQSPFATEYEHDHECDYEGILGGVGHVDPLAHTRTRRTRTHRPTGVPGTLTPSGFLAPFHERGPLTSHHSQPSTSTITSATTRAFSEELVTWTPWCTSGDDEIAPARSSRLRSVRSPADGTIHQSPLTGEYEHDCEHLYEAFSEQPLMPLRGTRKR